MICNRNNFGMWNAISSMVALVIALGTVVNVSAQEKWEQWGDIPPEELKGMVLLDFIKDTPAEEKTLRVLSFLDVDPQSALQAVFFRRWEGSKIPDERIGVKIIIEGPCSVELNPVSRSIRQYEGIARKDIPETSKVPFSEKAKDEAVALARRLGKALGVSLSEVRTDAHLEGDLVWKIIFFQMMDGYLCPLNALVVSINGSSSTIRILNVTPFISTAQTEIKVDKELAISNACKIAKEKYAEYEGKKEVQGNIAVDKPRIYPVGIETDEKGNYVGSIGRLAWPVYMEGSQRILSIDCATGELLRRVK
ncbi:MAG: hypothetical protein L3K26_14385 [Candidatus Hydrogenedentes bacterium]|nr:hypothetical protein [Candidatus Hydrogenedentota bacterium]